MRTLILTEASTEWGSGHFYRCLSLAQSLESRGFAVSWLLSGDQVAAGLAKRVPRCMHSQWHTQEPLDISMDGIDLVIVDSYHATLPLYTNISEQAKQCLWIDDDGRLEYPRGTILNPNPPRSLTEWCQNNPPIRLLSGYGYQLLRKEFSASFARSISPSIQRILIMMGGTDPQKLTVPVIDLVQGLYPQIAIDVVLSDEAQIRTLRARNDANVCVHRQLGALDIRTLMERADLAISAAGQTLCETCRLGLPAIAIITAENQERHANALQAHDAIRIAGNYADPDLFGKLKDRIQELFAPEARQQLSTAGVQLIDGRGSERVLSDLFDWSLDYRLRPAKREDSQAIWRISNLESVRKHSLSKESIPWEKHEQWFGAALDSRDLLFLAVYAGSDIASVFGQVRYKLEHDALNDRDFATVSISLDEAIRGKGEATKLLREGDQRCFEHFNSISFIEALISPQNIASEKTFLRAGYCRKEEPRMHDGQEFLVYHKERRHG